MFREKKNIVRLAVFLLAALIAVGSVTAGVLGFLHRDSGYHDVDYSVQTAVTLFDSGVHLRYYLSGSSSRIRADLREVQDVYSDALLWAYRQLDEDGTYEGVRNLASLNAAPGEWVEISAFLADTLRDALRRTEAGQGYSLFAGPLFREWRTLRWLEEPAEADPVNRPEEADLLREMTAWLRDPDAFSLEVEDGRARLNVSEPYRAWARENDIGAPVLSLNLMKDVYLLEYVAGQLRGRGFSSGYLYTDSGFSVQMADTGSTPYRVPGAPKAAGPSDAGEIVLPSPSAFCRFAAFPMNGERYGYYALEGESGPVYRHAFVSTESGEPARQVLTAALGGPMTELREMAYSLVILCTAQDPAAEAAAIVRQPRPGVFLAFTLQDAPAGPVYFAGEGTMTPAEGVELVPVPEA